MGGACVADRVTRAARHRLRRDHRRRARDARAGLLPRPLRHARPSAMLDGSWSAALDAAARRRASSRRSTGDRASSSRATPARSRSAPTRRGRDRAPCARRGASTSRSCATARAACSGSSRWSRSRRRRAAIAYGPVEPQRRRRPVRRRLARRRRARASPRADRGDSVPEAADAADLRALRHHRSALARRLPRAWRLRRASSARSTLQPAEIVDEVKLPGLRGRGGAGFPTGIKWNTVLGSPTATQKYIVCNADEGDSGTFADRMIMEGDPFVLIEGMTIAGLAVGATKGYIYIRSEYPHAAVALNAAIAAARRAGYLGANVAGSRQGLRPRGAARRRRLYLRRGDLAARKPRRQARAGARQAAAARRIKGLFGKPTVVNNVHLARDRAVHPGEGRARPIATSAWAARAARCRSSSPATSSTAACRDGLRHDARRARRRLRRRHRDRPAGARGAGRRAARRLFPASAVRHAARLRGVRRARRAGRPRRHRGVRRHRRHGASRPVSPSSSAPSRAAASARPAASARRAASR